MSQFAKWAGYVVALLAVALAGFLYARTLQLQAEIDAVTSENAGDDERDTAQRKADFDRIESEKDALAAELETTTSKIGELEGKLDELTKLAQVSPEPAAETPEAIETAEAEEEETPPTMDELRARLKENAQVSAQLRAVMEMSYADLLNELNLDPALKTAMRDLLLESQIERATLAANAYTLGDVTFKEFTKWENEEHARLASELKKLLPAEQYAAWEEYESDIDSRTLAATFENQIGAFSSGLTPENHDLVIQVAVEEFAAEMNVLRNSDTVYTMSENILYQFRAMDRMRERLQTTMPEDQYSELENWFRVGESALRGALPDEENNANANQKSAD